ncbi:unnamed protein product [Amaranthus hypochondriacus]
MGFRCFHLLPTFALLIIAVGVTSQAASSSEEYWEKMLPNTPMPKTIKDSFKTEGRVGVNVGNNGVDIRSGKPNKGSTNVHVGKGGTWVDVHPKGHPFLYKYAATQTQLKDNPNIALFFLQKHLKPGTQMNLHFTKSPNGAILLPRKISESIPLSSDKIPQILTRFNVKSNSNEAKVMTQTIKECEAKGLDGEDQMCATSLESMVDYVISKLGKELDTISTNTGKQEEIKTQKYTFTGVKKMSEHKAVVCHKMDYPCAVFYCHKTEKTKTYMVSLMGVDGTKVKGAVICHSDTSKWNPKHLAFQVLKVEPGSVPVCHFLPEDHVVWVPK